VRYLRFIRNCPTTVSCPTTLSHFCIAVAADSKQNSIKVAHQSDSSLCDVNHRQVTPLQMLTQRKTSFTNGWQKGSVPPQLINVHSLSGNRQYLSEMKGFDDLYTPKNIVLYGLKAAIIPANYVMSEFNAHMIEAENRSDEEMEDFDFQESVHRNAKLFIPNLQRVVTVSVLRKFYEYLALMKLPARITDKLTKDITASMARKVQRFPRLLACRKIFRTSLRGGAIFNLACFTYDVGLHLFNDALDFLSGQKDSKSAVERVGKNIVFVVKKGIFYTVCLTSGAMGYAVGTFMHTSYGGTLGAFIFEMLGAVFCSALLDDAPVVK